MKIFRDSININNQIYKIYDKISWGKNSKNNNGHIIDIYRQPRKVLPVHNNIGVSGSGDVTWLGDWTITRESSQGETRCQVPREQRASAKRLHRRHLRDRRGHRSNDTGSCTHAGYKVI